MRNSSHEGSADNPHPEEQSPSPPPSSPPDAPHAQSSTAALSSPPNEEHTAPSTEQDTAPSTASLLPAPNYSQTPPPTAPAAEVLSGLAAPPYIPSAANLSNDEYSRTQDISETSDSPHLRPLFDEGFSSTSSLSSTPSPRRREQQTSPNNEANEQSPRSRVPSVVLAIGQVPESRTGANRTVCSSLSGRANLPEEGNGGHPAIVVIFNNATAAEETGASFHDDANTYITSIPDGLSTDSLPPHLERDEGGDTAGANDQAEQSQDDHLNAALGQDNIDLEITDPALFRAFITAALESLQFIVGNATSVQMVISERTPLSDAARPFMTDSDGIGMMSSYESSFDRLDSGQSDYEAAAFAINPEEGESVGDSHEQETLNEEEDAKSAGVFEGVSQDAINSDEVLKQLEEPSELDPAYILKKLRFYGEKRDIRQLSESKALSQIVAVKAALSKAVYGTSAFSKVHRTIRETLGYSGPCTVQWSLDQLCFRCDDCAKDSTCVICERCFFKGNHEGHLVRVCKAQDGCCDCGDSESWDPAGFCSDHHDIPTEEDGIASVSKLHPKLVATMTRHINYCITYLDSTLWDSSANVVCVTGVLRWLQDLSLTSNGFLWIICSSLDDSLLNSWVLKHSSLSGSIYQAVHRLYVLLFRSHNFKIRFSRSMSKHYIKEISSILSSSKRRGSIVKVLSFDGGLSVQIMTVASIAMILIKEGFLAKMIQYLKELYPLLRKNITKQISNGLFTLHINIHSALQFLLKHEEVCSLILKDPELQGSLMDHLSLYSGFCIQMRYVSKHVENPDDSSFMEQKIEFMEYNTFEPLSAAIKQLNLDSHLDLLTRVYTNMTSRVKILYSRLNSNLKKNIRGGGNQFVALLNHFMIFSLNFETVAYAIMKVPTNPKLREFANIFSEELLNVVLQFCGRTLRFAEEIDKGYWRRNGGAVEEELSYYMLHSFLACDMMGLQCSVALLGLWRFNEIAALKSGNAINTQTTPTVKISVSGDLKSEERGKGLQSSLASSGEYADPCVAVRDSCFSGADEASLADSSVSHLAERRELQYVCVASAEASTVAPVLCESRIDSVSRGAIEQSEGADGVRGKFGVCTPQGVGESTSYGEGASTSFGGGASIRHAAYISPPHTGGVRGPDEETGKGAFGKFSHTEEYQAEEFHDDVVNPGFLAYYMFCFPEFTLKPEGGRATHRDVLEHYKALLTYSWLVEKNTPFDSKVVTEKFGIFFFWKTAARMCNDLSLMEENTFFQDGIKKAPVSRTVPILRRQIVQSLSAYKGKSSLFEVAIEKAWISRELTQKVIDEVAESVKFVSGERKSTLKLRREAWKYYDAFMYNDFKMQVQDSQDTALQQPHATLLGPERKTSGMSEQYQKNQDILVTAFCDSPLLEMILFSLSMIIKHYIRPPPSGFPLGVPPATVSPSSVTDALTASNSQWGGGPPASLSSSSRAADIADAQVEDNLQMLETGGIGALACLPFMVKLLDIVNQCRLPSEDFSFLPERFSCDRLKKREEEEFLPSLKVDYSKERVVGVKTFNSLPKKAISGERAPQGMYQEGDLRVFAKSDEHEMGVSTTSRAGSFPAVAPEFPTSCSLVEPREGWATQFFDDDRSPFTEHKTSSTHTAAQSLFSAASSSLPLERPKRGASDLDEVETPRVFGQSSMFQRAELSSGTHTAGSSSLGTLGLAALDAGRKPSRLPTRRILNRKYKEALIPYLKILQEHNDSPLLKKCVSVLLDRMKTSESLQRDPSLASKALKRARALQAKTLEDIKATQKAIYDSRKEKANPSDLDQVVVPDEQCQAVLVECVVCREPGSLLDPLIFPGVLSHSMLRPLIKEGKAAFPLSVPGFQSCGHLCHRSCLLRGQKNLNLPPVKDGHNEIPPRFECPLCVSVCNGFLTYVPQDYLEDDNKPWEYDKAFDISLIEAMDHQSEVLKVELAGFADSTTNISNEFTDIIHILHGRQECGDKYSMMWLYRERLMKTMFCSLTETFKESERLTLQSLISKYIEEKPEDPIPYTQKEILLWRSAAGWHLYSCLFWVCYKEILLSSNFLPNEIANPLQVLPHLIRHLYISGLRSHRKSGEVTSTPSILSLKYWETICRLMSTSHTKPEDKHIFDLLVGRRRVIDLDSMEERYEAAEFKFLSPWSCDTKLEFLRWFIYSDKHSQVDVVMALQLFLCIRAMQVMESLLLRECGKFFARSREDLNSHREALRDISSNWLKARWQAGRLPRDLDLSIDWLGYGSEVELHLPIRHLQEEYMKLSKKSVGKTDWISDGEANTSSRPSDSDAPSAARSLEQFEFHWMVKDCDRSYRSDVTSASSGIPKLSDSAASPSLPTSAPLLSSPIFASDSSSAYSPTNQVEGSVHTQHSSHSYSITSPFPTHSLVEQSVESTPVSTLVSEVAHTLEFPTLGIQPPIINPMIESSTGVSPPSQPQSSAGSHTYTSYMLPQTLLGGDGITRKSQKRPVPGSLSASEDKLGMEKRSKVLPATSEGTLLLGALSLPLLSCTRKPTKDVSVFTEGTAEWLFNPEYVKGGEQSFYNSSKPSSSIRWAQPGGGTIGDDADTSDGDKRGAPSKLPFRWTIPVEAPFSSSESERAGSREGLPPFHSSAAPSSSAFSVVSAVSSSSSSMAVNTGNDASVGYLVGNEGSHQIDVFMRDAENAGWSGADTRDSPWASAACATSSSADGVLPHTTSSPTSHITPSLFPQPTSSPTPQALRTEEHTLPSESPFSRDIAGQSSTSNNIHPPPTQESSAPHNSPPVNPPPFQEKNTPNYPPLTHQPAASASHPPASLDFSKLEEAACPSMKISTPSSVESMLHPVILDASSESYQMADRLERLEHGIFKCKSPNLGERSFRESLLGRAFWSRIRSAFPQRMTLLELCSAPLGGGFDLQACNGGNLTELFSHIYKHLSENMNLLPLGGVEIFAGSVTEEVEVAVVNEPCVVSPHQTAKQSSFTLDPPSPPLITPSHYEKLLQMFQEELLEALSSFLVFAFWTISPIWQFDEATINFIALCNLQSPSLRYQRLCEILGLDRSLEKGGLLKAVTSFLWNHNFCEAHAYGRKNSVEMIPPFTDILTPLKMVDLPTDFFSLLKELYPRKCPVDLHKPQTLSLCLLCGAVVCLCQLNKRVPFGGIQQPEILDHTNRCGAGQGLYLIPSISTVLYVDKLVCAFFDSPYLDHNDEADKALLRGFPLTLNQREVNKLEQLFMFGRVGQEIWKHPSSRFV